MGKTIHKGRYTTDINQEEFAVFIIGLRINQLFSFTKWVPVFKAMGPMIKELYQNPQLGFLHYEILFGWRRITLIQYWKGFEELVNYAHGDTHLLAWKSFNQKVNDNGSVGIFHETFQVERGSCESIYNNMPMTGLAKAFAHVPVSSHHNTAKKRMGTRSFN